MFRIVLWVFEFAGLLVVDAFTLFLLVLFGAETFHHIQVRRLRDIKIAPLAMSGCLSLLWVWALAVVVAATMALAWPPPF